MDLILRQLSMVLDLIVYNLIPLFYDTLVSIAEVSILSRTVIENFAGRVYLIIGIVMLFKLTFSLIKMFASPDSAKGDKGVGKLVQKVIVMLILLVSVPTIFEWGYKIQNVILKENILGNLVLGGSSIGDEKMEEEFKTAGNLISISVFKGFFYPASENGSLVSTWKDIKKVNDVWDNSMQTEKTGGEYSYTYHALISTAAGGLTAWIIGIFCFDIAVRSVKLAFLQLIAPVPIIASIDPKGQKTFDNWMQNCIKTFLDVFIRLLALYLVVFIVIEITAQGLFNFYVPGTDDLAPNVNFFVGAMVIIGLLIFAKQMPKLLEDLLGIKLGGFTLNPFKKLEKAAGLGGLARMGSNAIGAGGSLAKNAMRLGGGAALDSLRGRDVKTGVENRKDAMLAEARGRMHNRSDKYSGETYSGILSKEREEISRNKTKGQKEIADRNKMMTDGKLYFEGSTNAKVKAFADAISNGLSVDDAKNVAAKAANRSIFQNEPFIKSLEKMDSEKGEMYKLNNLAQAADANYSGMVSKFGQNSDEAATAYKALEAANKDSGSAKSRYEMSQKEHESNRKIYVSDAIKQDAKDVYEKTERQVVLKEYETRVTESYTTVTNSPQPSNVNQSNTGTTNNTVKIKPGDIKPVIRNDNNK